MRAHTINILLRPSRSTWSRVLVLLVGVCALAIPMSVSADPLGKDGSPLNTLDPRPSERHSPNDAGYSPYGGPDYATPNAILGGDGVVEDTPVAGLPANPADGFDWPSAAVGAGAVAALTALAGAALLTFRRRTAASPSASAS